MRVHPKRHGQAASVITAVLLTAAFIVPTASGIAATTESNGVPQKLVGRWVRDAKATTFPSWSMLIKKSGAVAFYQPGSSYVDFTTTFNATVGGRLNVGTVPICSTKAVYRWKVSGRLLTITKVSDKKCPDRVKLYSGVWKRK